MLSSLQKNIGNLPNEIQQIILSYSYNQPPKELLDDIKGFNQTLDILYDFITELESNENFYFISAKDEIHNELFNYMYYHICDGKMDSINDHFFNRLFMYDSEKKSYYLFNENNSLGSEIRAIWGLFTNHERYDFIDYYSNEMQDLYQEIEEEIEEEDFDF